MAIGVFEALPAVGLGGGIAPIGLIRLGSQLLLVPQSTAVLDLLQSLHVVCGDGLLSRITAVKNLR